MLNEINRQCRAERAPAEPFAFYSDEEILTAIDQAWYDEMKGELQWEDDAELRALLLGLYSDGYQMIGFDYEGAPTFDELPRRACLALIALHYGSIDDR